MHPLPDIESESRQQHEDPLQAPPSSMRETALPSYANDQELINIVSEVHAVDMNAEDMDPIEWTFRRLVPIPSHYYWDVVPDKAEATKKIPTKIRMWHNTISALDVAFKWTDCNVGKPLASFLGLTDSRFSDVTIHMNDDDWKESTQFVAERKSAGDAAHSDKSISVDVAESGKESQVRKGDSISSVDYF